MVLRGTTRLLHGYSVTTANNGKEALRLIAAGPSFDVILCDLVMPVMTGMELYQELARVFPKVLDRLIFISGGVFTPTARVFLERIPNLRLDKPFDSKKLRALVKEYVDTAAQNPI
jgi:CheY-like chemotaxis protein